MIKVIFGVRTTDDNKTYQVILDDCDGTVKTPFIGNAVTPDKNTGEYALARKRIDAYYDENENTDCTFSASPVREWDVTPTDVKESDAPAPNTATASGSSQSYVRQETDDDLPF